MTPRTLAALTAALVGAVLLGATPALAPAPAAAAGSKASLLRVGTFNVRSVQFDTQRVRHEAPWRKRRAVVIAQILRERIHVLGVQEASQNEAYAGRLVDGRNQFLDLRNGLNKAGGHYEVTQTAGKAGRGTRILYDTRLLRPLSVGTYRYRHQSRGRYDTRHLVWAVFRHLRTGREFLFANTHLGIESQALQKAQWQELVSRVQALRGGRPVVVVGDFQASKLRDPAATMMVRMRDAGFGDVLGQRPRTDRLASPRAATIVRGWVNSFNGFRRKVATFAYERHRDWIANNADWVFASNRWGVRAYKTVLSMRRLTLRGVIPSDHNLVRATLEMR